MNKRELNISNANKVIDIINNYFNILEPTKSRKLQSIIPRQIAQYFLRKKLKLIYQSIADIYKQTPATIMNSCRKIKDYIEYDSEISYHISNISNLLRNDKYLQKKIYAIEKIEELNEINNLLEDNDIFRLRKIKEYLLGSLTKV
jgi:hypothetical protein